MIVTNLSLSVVLPIFNGERTLARKVSQLLEILPDLTTNFEILIINNGSTDNTEEIAFEQARLFPQVHVARHSLRRGPHGVLETGLAETANEIVFVQDEHAEIDSGKLLRLWELRNEEDVVFARPEFRMKRSLLQRLAAWGVRLEEATQGGGSAGVQMIRRQSLDRLDELEAIGPDPTSSSTSSSKHSRTDRPELRGESQPGPKFTAVERPRNWSRQP